MPTSRTGIYGSICLGPGTCIGWGKAPEFGCYSTCGSNIRMYRTFLPIYTCKTITASCLSKTVSKLKGDKHMKRLTWSYIIGGLVYWAFLIFNVAVQVSHVWLDFFCLYCTADFLLFCDVMHLIFYRRWKIKAALNINMDHFKIFNQCL